MSVRRRVTSLAAITGVLLGLAVPPAQAADHGWVFSPIGQGRDACPTYYVCIWTGTNFTGTGVGFTGTILRGDSMDWRPQIWENNVHSAVNKTTIVVTFFDYVKDPDRPQDPGWYVSLGSLYPGYDFRSGWAGADRADRIAYV